MTEFEAFVTTLNTESLMARLRLARRTPGATAEREVLEAERRRRLAEILANARPEEEEE